jgi:FtsP/CotA-like multicopper oxidase with cupredoxin domain
MMHANALPVGSNYPIFTVRVTKKVTDSPKLPTQLSKITKYKISDTANPQKPVPIAISEAPMAMLINGRPYAYNDVQPYERIPVNTIQLMEIFHAHGGSGGHGNQSAATDDDSSGNGMQHGQMGGMGMHGRMGMMNRMGNQNGDEQSDTMQRGQHGMGMMHGMNQQESGQQTGGMMGMRGGMGMMMAMAHPIHMHGQSFQIVSRSISDDAAEDYTTVRDGLIESGWKDTVLVMPGERVRLIKPFEDFKGLFMYHCHNLEHEDMGMMRDFMVE